MTIAQSTTIQAYQLKKGGARARMAILRMIAADSVNNANESTRLDPGDWRGARRYTLGTYADAYAIWGAGFDETYRGNRVVKAPVWYSHTGPQFRDERFADECEGGPDHRGWFTNDDGATYKDGSGIARGIVARLTHGRFIAGYHWGDNGERVYFSEVFDSERDAARAADSRAEYFAEKAREDSARFNAMQDAENEAEHVRALLAKRWSTRNVTEALREEVRDLIDELREKREELRARTAEYEGA